MASLLDDVVRHLERNDVRAALIGAAAMALHGFTRATLDSDFVTADFRILQSSFWEPLRADTDIDIRRGDFEDPLAGIVRLTRAGDRPVDVIIPKYAVARVMAERAQDGVLEDVPLRVARMSDLVLMKLYGGSFRDAWDIQHILEHADPVVIDEVDAHITTLPPDAQELWHRIRSG